MKQTLIAAAALVFSALPGASMESLSQFEWKNRVLILFGAPGDQMLRDQMSALDAQTAELADRDMVVLHVRSDAVETIFGTATRLDAKSVIKETGMAPDRFAALLVGKDGGIKLKSREIVPAAALFDLVDRMPMRQNEQR